MISFKIFIKNILLKLKETMALLKNGEYRKFKEGIIAFIDGMIRKIPTVDVIVEDK